MLCSSKGLSYGVIFFLNFLTGVEYGVILPTALQYLKKYGGNQVELGFCVAAYSFSSLFSSPLMGFWSDRTSNLKLILLVSNLFQIGGKHLN
jgi:MFS family permease